MEIEPHPRSIESTLMDLPDPLREPVLVPERAGAFLKLGRTATYEAIRRGEIPAIRVGRRVLVPTAALRTMLGLPVAAG